MYKYSSNYSIKMCPICYRELKLSYFPQTKGKLYTYCIDCKRTIQRDWIRQKRRRERLNINLQKK